jgi:hypothetical protein
MGELEARASRQEENPGVAQIDPRPLYNQKLVERVIEYLQTGDTALFPFTNGFDDAQKRAFARDLRVGLSDITESGAKRGTSASGFITNDKRLKEIVEEWGMARGAWPAGSDPRDGFTSLSAIYDPRTLNYDTTAPTQNPDEAE